MATITLVSRAVLKSHDGYYLWYYLPSQPASIIMLIVFLALTLLNTWQMVKTKTWFVVVLVIGGFCKFFWPTISNSSLYIYIYT